MHYTDFTRYCETALQEMYTFNFLPSLPHIVQKNTMATEKLLFSRPYIAYATHWKNNTSFGIFMMHMHYDTLISSFRKVVFSESLATYSVDMQRLTPNATIHNHTTPQYDAFPCTIGTLLHSGMYPPAIANFTHANTLAHETIQRPHAHMTISNTTCTDPHTPLYYLEEFLGELTNIVSAKIRALHAQEFPQNTITGSPPYYTTQPPLSTNVVCIAGKEFSLYCSYTWNIP